MIGLRLLKSTICSCFLLLSLNSHATNVDGYIGLMIGEEETQDISSSGIFYGISGFYDIEDVNGLRISFLISQQADLEPEVSIGTINYITEFGDYFLDLEVGKTILSYGLYDPERIIPSVDKPKTLNETFLAQSFFETFPNADIGGVIRVSNRNYTFKFGYFKPRLSSFETNISLLTAGGVSDNRIESIFLDNVSEEHENTFNESLGQLDLLNLLDDDGIRAFRRTRSRLGKLLLYTFEQIGYEDDFLRQEQISEFQEVSQDNFLAGIHYDNDKNVKVDLSYIMAKNTMGKDDVILDMATGGIEYKFMKNLFSISEFLAVKSRDSDLNEGILGLSQTLFMDDYPYGYYINFSNYSVNNDKTNLNELNLGIIKNWDNISARLNYRVIKGDVFILGEQSNDPNYEGCSITCEFINELLPMTSPTPPTPEIIDNIDENRVEFRIRYNF